MDQHLTIKSDEAVRLADELSALSGESVEAAVVSALRARIEQQRGVKERMRRISEWAADIRAHLRPGPSDHDWLYDEETGLPK